MLLFTDPRRTPDPAASAERLPRGAGVVYRAFGAADAIETGRALARVCRRRGLVLFVGADPNLAIRLGADGLHLPRTSGFPPWLRPNASRPLSGDRLSPQSRRRASSTRRRRRCSCGLASALLQPEPVCGAAAGSMPALAYRFVRQADVTVYALGGVNTRTVAGLRMTGVTGFAAIEALS